MKNEIRLKIKEQLSIMSEVEKETESKQILETLENNNIFKNASNILMYWSLDNEVRTHEFINKWHTKKNIYLPVIIDNELKIKKYTKEMVNGKYNINEPVGEVYNASIDLVIVPGLAFDQDNNRLGRGKGYYDRLLKNLDTYKIGICFKCQLIDKIPKDKWDIKMNEIATFTQFDA